MKLFNANYLHEVPATNQAVNEKNRSYIDRFVSENYKSLSTRFAAIGSNINSSAYGSLDKLNETLLSLYTNSDLLFDNWSDANAYLRNKFTEKEMRIPLKKQSKNNETENEDVSNDV